MYILVLIYTDIIVTDTTSVGFHSKFVRQVEQITLPKFIDE